MGLREDLERFREVGEDRRQDLSDFIQHGDLGESLPDEVRIPVKIVDLPEFEYDKRDQGGVGQGDVDVGEPVGQPQPQPGDDDEEGDPGEEGGDHEYYEMDPEEFAQELDEELGLDLEPKGKQVVEENEGPYKELARQGATEDFEILFKKGLKRGLALAKDEDWLEDLLKVKDMGPQRAFEWARSQNIPVSKPYLQQTYEELVDSDEDVSVWEDIDSLVEDRGEYPEQTEIFMQDPGKNWKPRSEDERYRHPEIIEEKEKNVVVVNIRDVSGSMREKKRELVERTFTPLDWYLQGKYDNAEFIYIAHDAEAWEVEREEFFGIRSGGGTKISSAYELAESLLEDYPWSDWNRYVFAAGDSENSSNDTEERVIPLMEQIPANLHAYLETQPGGGKNARATHAEEVENHFGDSDDVAVAYVNSEDDVMDAIYDILSTEADR